MFHQLGRWRELKEVNPALKIGVGGCVASQEGEAISERAPFVDLVFGPQTLHRLPEMLSKQKDSGIAVVDISFPEIEKFDRLPEPRSEDSFAFGTGRARSEFAGPERQCLSWLAGWQRRR